MSVNGWVWAAAGGERASVGRHQHRRGGGSDQPTDANGSGRGHGRTLLVVVTGRSAITDATGSHHGANAAAAQAATSEPSRGLHQITEQPRPHASRGLLRPDGRCGQKKWTRRCHC